MIEFPASPVIGDTYSYNGRTWEWNGSGWERVINSGQVVAVFVTPGVEVVSLATSLSTIDNGWHTLNYV